MSSNTSAHATKKCREAFNTFDADGSGTIDADEMRLLLEAIGETPTEEELLRFMADVDEGGKGEIEFSEFLRAFDKQRNATLDPTEEEDILAVFEILGGNADKTGFVDRNKFITTVRDKFGMTIKADKLLDELDVDKDGKVNFTEFRNLFL
jgi:Ca2+-binding EF-hand superfamily protein